MDPEVVPPADPVDTLRYTRRARHKGHPYDVVGSAAARDLLHDPERVAPVAQLVAHRHAERAHAGRVPSANDIRIT